MLLRCREVKLRRSLLWLELLMYWPVSAKFEMLFFWSAAVDEIVCSASVDDVTPRLCSTAFVISADEEEITFFLWWLVFVKAESTWDLSAGWPPIACLNSALLV